MSEHVDVLIVGAGLSGDRRRLPPGGAAARHVVRVLEARDAIGGTWDLFRYPGIRSDSDMYTLGYRFRPWTGEKAIADGPSILAYVRETARELRRRGEGPLRRAGRRRLVVERRRDLDRAARARRRADDLRLPVVLQRLLPLRRRLLARVRGRRGRSRGAGGAPAAVARGPDYDGKRVVVIGSGATAVTLVPAMAERAAHVTMLQRSPTYIALAAGHRQDRGQAAREAAARRGPTP